MTSARVPAARVPISPLTLGQRPAAQSGPAWLAKGFRPFFLLAAAFAALAVPAWIAVLHGLPWPQSTLGPLEWHAHEMVFGFAGAVIAGFLLTAVSNWTGRTTLEGGALAGLCALWLGARISPFLGGAGAWVAAAFDAAFWLGLALACARPIVASKNARNYGFIALLSAFFAAATVSHAARLGVWPAALGLGRTLGVDLFTIAILVVTGRVVPMFTRNATGATDIASAPALDRAAVALMVLLTIFDAARVPAATSAPLSALVGILALVRARRWGARHTLGKPLLWPLHLGHGWIGAGLILRGLSPFVSGLPASVALHAVTAGGIGMLCLAMMTRVTLGHTGRMLAVPPRMAFALHALSAAVLVRVLGPLLAPVYAQSLLALSAALWSLAFALYLVVYAGPLTAPRADGRPG